jgi:hypothetical protein
VLIQTYPGVVVGGGNDTTGALRARPLRGRPHWWAVLAVALSLMALLAATSSSGPGVTRPGHHGVALNPPAPQTPAHGAPLGSTTTTTTAASAAHDLGSPSAGHALGPTAVVSALQPATATTTTTSVTTTTVGSGVGSGPSPQTRTQQGYLQPPDNTSAMYTFTADGPTQVSVSWATADTLLLSVTCPSGTVNEQGSSSVTITTADTSGQCQATLSEPASDSSTVSYDITIEPAP